MIALYLIFIKNLQIHPLICITAAITRNTLKITLLSHWDKETLEQFPRIRNNILTNWHLVYHPKEVLNYKVTKHFLISFKSQNESNDYITFVQTYNPNTNFNKIIINNSLKIHGKRHSKTKTHYKQLGKPKTYKITLLEHDLI